jgi:hypothetical protein
MSRIGIRIGAETRDIRCEENRIEGFATSISDRSYAVGTVRGRV